MMFRLMSTAARSSIARSAALRVCSLRAAPIGLRSIRFFSADAVEGVVSRKPTIADVIDSPREYYEMPPDVLLTLAVAEDPDARTERLVREIMVIDTLSWDDAQPVVSKIRDDNMAINSTQTMISKTYFKTMAFVSISMGLASFPLCFDLYTTLWFNNLAVTTDVPLPDVSCPQIARGARPPPPASPPPARQPAAERPTRDARK